MSEKRSVGIWLDKREAFLVYIEGNDLKEEKLDSGVETRVRHEGESKDSMRMGDQFSVPEQKKERRLDSEMKQYFDTLRAKLDQNDSVVLFGPGEVPTAFKKHLSESSAWKNASVEVKKADSMSDAQKTAWVKEHFGKPAARKPHPQG